MGEVIRAESRFEARRARAADVPERLWSGSVTQLQPNTYNLSDVAKERLRTLMAALVPADPCEETFEGGNREALVDNAVAALIGHHVAVVEHLDPKEVDDFEDIKNDSMILLTAPEQAIALARAERVLLQFSEEIPANYIAENQIEY